MRGLPGWALKGAALGLTVLAAVASAGYVGGHVKNQSAPLRPALQPGAVQAPDRLGQVNVAPGTRTTSQPVTQVHVS